MINFSNRIYVRYSDKERIDDCRDILVGKLPDPKAQIEQTPSALSISSWMIWVRNPLNWEVRKIFY